MITWLKLCENAIIYPNESDKQLQKNCHNNVCASITKCQLRYYRLGNANSAKDESFENDLLEYPQYTKPRDWEGKKVPEVLFSGDHAKIKGWRLSQSEAITQRQRPDLWKKYLEKKNEKHWRYK